MRLFVLLACLCSALSLASATEVIVVIKPTGTILATDSMQAASHGSSTNVCKIFQTGQLFWTLKGIPYIPRTGFRVSDFITEKNIDGRNLGQILDGLDSTLAPALDKQIPYVEENDPGYLRMIVNGGGHLLGLYAVMLRGQQVQAYYKGFRIVNGHIKPEPAWTCDDKPYCTITTRQEDAQYQNDHPHTFSGDIVKAVDGMMRNAQKIDPHFVGPPYSIVSITPRGAKYLRQGVCPDILPMVTSTPNSPK
jgi:hypothetical protein